MNTETNAYEIEVTNEAIRAGIEEMRQHNLGDDWGYVLECVYRAMAYESVSASSIKDSM